jgi:hypothetical protein
MRKSELLAPISSLFPIEAELSDATFVLAN